jgi:hypothetical protein
MCQLMTTRTGETIPVKTSKELCSNFKFQPEDKIKHPEFGEATVRGIGKDSLMEEDQIWIQKNGCNFITYIRILEDWEKVA